MVKRYFVICFLSTLCISTPHCVEAVDTPIVEEGIIDLRGYHFEDQEIVKLDGDWEFYYNQLYTPFELDHTLEDAQRRYRYFPKLWDGDSIDNMKIESKGFASYRVRLLINLSTASDLALSVPPFFSSYILYVNGDHFTSNGFVGTNSEISEPYSKNIVKSIYPLADTVDLVLHISNFLYVNGGANHSVLFGEQKTLLAFEKSREAWEIFMSASLFFIGLFFLLLFTFDRSDLKILFYALFCLVFSYVSVVNGNMLFSLLPELSWGYIERTNHLSVFLSIIIFSFYTYHLYPKETSHIFVALIATTCSICLGIILIFPPQVFTKLIFVILVIVILGYLYVFYTYIVAWLNRRRGSLVSIISTTIFVIGNLSVIFDRLGLNEYWYTYSYLFFILVTNQQFFFFQSVIFFYRHNKRMELAKTMAEKAMNSKFDFIYMISHEIRTPLNTVIGLANFLIGDEPKKKHFSDLKTLKFSAEHLHVLINDVLDYSKLDIGKIEFEEIDTGIQEMIQNIVKVFEIRAKEKGISLQLLIDDSIPPFVICDGLRLRQVLTNVIGNAVKFTNTGHVKVHVVNSSMENNRITIEFKVEDTGIGIAEGKIDEIFDSFVQASSSTTRKYGGTGLGLTISKRILNLQNIELNVLSELGKGSTFYFSQTFEISDNQVFVNDRVQDLVSLEGKKVLLVEDNPINAMVMRKFLYRWKMKIDLGNNGVEALEMTEKKDYDLILMDLQLPLMDGYSATKELRRMGTSTPIIAITAALSKDVKKKIVSVGMNDLIIKPFDPNDLLNKLIYHLKNSKLN